MPSTAFTFGNERWVDRDDVPTTAKSNQPDAWAASAAAQATRKERLNFLYLLYGLDLR